MRQTLPLVLDFSCSSSPGVSKKKSVIPVELLMFPTYKLFWEFSFPSDIEATYLAVFGHVKIVIRCSQDHNSPALMNSWQAMEYKIFQILE